MRQDGLEAEGGDDAPWQWPGSRLWLRGPHRAVAGSYVAVLGGTETFGRFVAKPYPDMLEEALGMRCLNLGVAHAGPDAFLADEALLSVCAGAAATVIAVGGAHAISNRFYSVHPRRNDRVIRPEPALCALYPELDFSQHSFVRHLLGDLERASPRRFGQVRDEVQRVWVERMQRLCARIGGEIVLLWMGGRSPDEPDGSIRDGDPPLVTREMLDALAGAIRGKVEAIDLTRGGAATAGFVCRPAELRAAQALPAPRLHHRAAGELATTLRPLLAPRAVRSLRA